MFLVEATNPASPAPAPTRAAAEAVLDQVARVMPIAGFEYLSFETVPFAASFVDRNDGPPNEGWSQLSRRIDPLRPADEADVLYLGLVASTVTRSSNGIGMGDDPYDLNLIEGGDEGDPGSSRLRQFGVATAIMSWTVVVQEVGHALGRRHTLGTAGLGGVTCGTEENPDPAYPNYGSTGIANHATIGEFGFDADSCGCQPPTR